MSLRSTLSLLAASALSLTLVAGAPQEVLGADRHSAQRSAAGPVYVALTGGATTLSLDPATAQVLTDNGISVAPVSAARATASGIAFPVQGGLLNTRTLAGRVTHSGGLTFSAGGKDLTIRDFTINTRSKTLSAWVDQVGKRLTILDLKLGKIRVTLTRHHLTISKVTAVLDQGAADALNAYYATSLFSGGLKIGTAVVSARSKVLRG
jgi:hypothetical protein